MGRTKNEVLAYYRNYDARKRDTVIKEALLQIIQPLAPVGPQPHVRDSLTDFAEELATEIYYQAVGFSRKKHSLPHQEVSQSSIIELTEAQPAYSEEEVFMNAAILKALADQVSVKSGNEARELLKRGDTEALQERFPEWITALLVGELFFSVEAKNVTAYSSLLQIFNEIVDAVDVESRKEDEKQRVVPV